MDNKKRLIPFSATHVGSVIKDELEYLGLSQAELSGRTGISKTVISELAHGKRGLNADMAVRISRVIGIPEDLLMGIQSRYELDCAAVRERDENDSLANEELARYGDRVNFGVLFKKLGIDTAHPQDALNELCALLRVGSLGDVPLTPAFSRSRKTGLDYRQIITWTLLARCRANLTDVPRAFRTENEDDLVRELSSIFNSNIDTERRTKEALSKYGIKYCVEPKLEKASVNGCSFMSGGIPAIVVTKRIGTIDNFAFTIMHEVCHVFHHLSDGCEPHVNYEEYSDDPIEKEADGYAQDALIDKRRWESAPMVQMNVHEIQRAYSRWAEVNGIHKWIVLGRISREIGVFSFRRDQSRNLT